MGSKVQAYLQAERFVADCRNDPEVKRYLALRQQLQAIESGKASVDPEGAINGYLDGVAINEKITVFDIRRAVLEAAFIPYNRGLANIIRGRADFSDTGEKFDGNSVFVKLRKVTA